MPENVIDTTAIDDHKALHDHWSWCHGFNAWFQYSAQNHFNKT